jgi:hypothetical protein
MKVYVVFDIPGIDPDDEDADEIIAVLEDTIDELGYEWYIDDATED